MNIIKNTLHKLILIILIILIISLLSGCLCGCLSDIYTPKKEQNTKVDPTDTFEEDEEDDDTSKENNENANDEMVVQEPVAADFDNFKQMFTESRNVWSNSDNFSSSELSTSEIIDNYITYYLFCYYLTFFDNDTITKEEHDPLNKLAGCRKFEGENIDWIIKNVFNKTPDYSSSTPYHYYYQGNWYVEGYQGVGDDGVNTKSISEEHTQISENRYVINIEHIFDNTFTGETEAWKYVFTVQFKCDDDLGRYWSIESFSKSEISI